MATKPAKSRKAPRGQVKVKSSAGSRSGIKRAGRRGDGPPMKMDGHSWSLDNAGVSVHRDPAGGRATLVRHIAYPYESAWDETPAQLFSIANDYLAKVAPALELPDRWLDDLAPPHLVDDGPRPLYLRWLRNAPGKPDIQSPWQQASSFWSSRRYLDDDLLEMESLRDLRTRADPAAPLDRTAVLVAGLIPRTKDEYAPDQWILNGGRGLRVLAHIRPATRAAKASVRITCVYSTLPTWSGRNNKAIAEITPLLSIDAALVLLSKQVAGAFGIDPKDVTECGLRPPDDLDAKLWTWMVLARAKSNTITDPDGLSHLLIGSFSKISGYVPNARIPLVAFADVDAPVFAQDPISRAGLLYRNDVRPNRPQASLDPWSKSTRFRNLPLGKPGMAQLVDPPRGPAGGPLVSNFMVTNSRFVEPGASESAPKEVTIPLVAGTRTNDFAAANAYFHTSRMFRRMRRFGLQPDDYFHFAQRPIKVRYRSTIVPGARDGRTVNAQVRWNAVTGATVSVSAPGTIDLCFALGDLSGSSSRAPLGISADPRWCWHEFAHVLLAAAIGELEFRFAHSCGDAMAAIASDPKSKLADVAAWRGATFPWIEIADRRHDRDAAKGWSWQGSMYQREHTQFSPEYCDRRGYWAEQILSTTLFNLYRAIGGDAQKLVAGKRVADTRARKAASDYALYLIMRGIQLLGPANQVPAQTALVYMDALCNADVPDNANPGPLDYPPALVHKVVVWAFREQGLETRTVSTAGAVLPCVELHLADRRHDTTKPVPTNVSAYAPVNFVDNTWHARTETLRVQHTIAGKVDAAPKSGAKNSIFVGVHNLGDKKAVDVTVEVWVAAFQNEIPPFPNPVAAAGPWQKLDTKTDDVPRNTAAAGPGHRQFGPFAWQVPPTAGKKYALLATATCDDDPANTTPSTALPTALNPSPVKYLVAFDDNIALREVRSV